MPSRLGHGLYKKIDGLKNIFRCIYIITCTCSSVVYYCTLNLNFVAWDTEKKYLYSSFTQNIYLYSTHTIIIVVCFIHPFLVSLHKPA